MQLAVDFSTQKNLNFQTLTPLAEFLGLDPQLDEILKNWNFKNFEEKRLQH